jgi:hypothetical protein
MMMEAKVTSGSEDRRYPALMFLSPARGRG